MRLITIVLCLLLAPWSLVLAQSTDDLLDLTLWSSADGGNDHYYAIIPIGQSYTAHQEYAAGLIHGKEQGYLVTITSEAEDDFVFSLIQNHTDQPSGIDEFFLGGDSLANPGVWLWATGEPMVYTNMFPGEPSGDGPVLAMWGAASLYKAGFWNDLNGSYPLWAVVEFGELDMFPGPPVHLLNLTPWPEDEGGNGHYYAIVDIVQSWEHHRDYAPTVVNLGQPGYMATLTSAEEDAFVFSLIQDYTDQPSITDEFYIGGSKLTGTWAWLTGEPMEYTNWAPWEPSGDGFGMAMWGASQGIDKRGLWNDLPHTTDGHGSSHRLWALIEFDKPVYIPVAVDIKPGSCPNPMQVKIVPGEGDGGFERDKTAGGVLPVAVLGSADFDVSLIDPATVQLQGVTALRASVEDAAAPVVGDDSDCACNEDRPDGYDDLMLKFSRLEVARTLGAVSKGDDVKLTLTGELYDGTMIRGYDCILVVGKTVKAPKSKALLGNHPNPFNPKTAISFELDRDTHVVLDVFDVAGRRVARLADADLTTGIYRYDWSGEGFPSGVYMVRLQSGEHTETIKMQLVK